ncbi:hypothetical protein F5876DRAFT_61692 [Lentinula aff. lateritia]|uniref:Uncharacterized protein n=1 Tax=Lentinula aff. lateritia TaxID=2804960 RepID=A0ACC1UEX7_9AGAR|nr:hypothetical protein F5876DRAFT_61692 [Lentinula aff. lateritia]
MRGRFRNSKIILPMFSFDEFYNSEMLRYWGGTQAVSKRLYLKEGEKGRMQCTTRFGQLRTPGLYCFPAGKEKAQVQAKSAPVDRHMQCYRYLASYVLGLGRTRSHLEHSELTSIEEVLKDLAKLRDKSNILNVRSIRPSRWTWVTRNFEHMSPKVLDFRMQARILSIILTYSELSSWPVYHTAPESLCRMKVHDDVYNNLVEVREAIVDTWIKAAGEKRNLKF